MSLTCRLLKVIHPLIWVWLTWKKGFKMSDTGNFPAFSANTFLCIPQDIPPPPRPAAWHFFSFPVSFLWASSSPSLTLLAALCPQKCHPASAGRVCHSVRSLSALWESRCISSECTVTLRSAVTLRGKAELHAFSIARKTQSNHPPTLKRQRVGSDGGQAGRLRRGSLYKERVKREAAWQHGSWRMAF